MNVSYEYEKNLVAFCGQYCRDCVYYKNIFGIRAQDLLAEIERNEWIKMVWESLNAPFDAEDFITHLNWLASSPGCPGCLSGAGWPECPIRMCAQDKGVRGCFECTDFPCPVVSKEEAALQRQFTEKVRALGLEEYVKHKRGEFEEP